MKKPNSPLQVISLALPLCFVANAEELDSDLTADGVEVITVTSTGVERDINEIAANVVSISSKEIDSLASSNIRDILRYEPGVTVEGNGRFGLSGFNIRGINGDRILILLDGVPVADEFSFGPNLSARRDFVDVDLLKNVEIVRGPASTLYGSDAIGGVVSFISKDPLDILDEGENIGLRTKFNYAGQSSETSVNAQLALASGHWQALINGGYRNGSETETFFNDDSTGADRGAADPQDNSSKNALLKTIYTPNEQHRFVFTLDAFEQDSETTLLSQQNTVSRGVLTLGSEGIDERERERVSLSYTYTPQDSSLVRIHANAYYQDSETTQQTFTNRQSLSPTAPVTSARSRNSEFQQDIEGIRVQADHMFKWNGEHYLIYGVQWQQTDSEAIREGQTTNVATGENIREFSVFPARDFPISRLRESAIFVQDEIQFLDNRLTISPGIRFDDYKLTPTLDDLFTIANPGVEVATFEDDNFSKKMGVVYDASEQITVWTQYSEGFRIPPMDDVNVGFTNFAGGYTSLANPNLNPERVKSYEIGLRGSHKAFDWSVSAYKNDYEDFIESLSLTGFNPVTNLLEFQAINIDDVEISGVDLQASWYLGETFAGLDKWQVRLSTSVQDSEDKATGQELDSILPTQTVVGIQYGNLDDIWHVELATTFTNSANTIIDTANDVPFFTAPSFALLDLIFHYQINDNIRLNGGLFNVTDRRYWNASEVRGRAQGDNLNRFTAPGRNLSANLIVNF
ncbi:TonB-dependent hemoglobin/transferrin/lactoferrin family receptor [Alteromonadaceae bacterium M269]|nr:TonB-dependent hemoglobin/transferrin/lactoferrin family receptor [Alteromonadaceae bacterium M269]